MVLIPKNEWYSELPPIHYSLFKEKRHLKF